MAGALLERILAIVTEGPKHGTHKLALLLAILDSCVEGASADGVPPPHLRSVDLARRVIGLHWRHALPFVRADGSAITLAQVNASAKGPHVYLRAVADLRKASGADETTRIEQAIAACGPEYERAVERVEAALVKNPIPRLQTLGRQKASFLYEPRPARTSSGTKCTLELLPGAADDLLQFSPALRPLIEFEFGRKVAALNGLDREQDRLLAHLFGAPREVASLELRRDLLSLQKGQCFYSGATLRMSDAHVDHFIPWSRHALSTLENLVLAHARQNTAKSNHLPAEKFVHRWAGRLPSQSARLADIALRHRLEFAPKRTIAVAASLYKHLALDAPLWAGGSSFELAQPERILLALHSALGGH